MPSLYITLASVNDEMDGSRARDVSGSHGLIEIHGYSRIEKLPRGHEVLQMVSLK